MEFAAVLQAVNDVQRALVADHRRAGELEGELEFAAIWAGEWAFDFSRKRLTAGLTKRLGESWQVRVTGVAQGAAVG